MFDGVFDGETGGASTGPRIEVIGNSVEEDLATRALAGGASWSAEPTVAFVSNLMPEKGVDVVIEAARLAHDQGRAFRFVLAGHDPHGRATSLPPNARWAGVVADDAKFELLASAQVFVLPTSYRVEGEPISILEALHVGLPVVSSDQGGVADIVDETNGRLINPIDAEALLDAIDALTSDRSRWEAMSANNRRQAAECHSPNRHLEQLFATLGFQNPT